MILIEQITPANWNEYLKEKENNTLKFKRISIQVNRISPELYQLTIDDNNGQGNMIEWKQNFNHLLE